MLDAGEGWDAAAARELAEEAGPEDRRDPAEHRLRVVDGGDQPFERVQVPAPQALPLLTAAPALAAQVQTVRMRPTWTLMTAFGQPLDLPFDGAFVHGSEVLSWAARDNSKEGRPGAECWVLHARHGWSETHLEDEPAAVGQALLAAFSAAAGRALPEPTLVLPHRWRYAVPERPLSEPFLTALSGRLGLCGDWCGGPRIEGAFLSGRALARHLLDRFNP